MKKFCVTMLALLAVASTSAFALEANAPEQIATIRVERGTVLISDGSEFVSAQSGAPLFEGQRIMVAEGAEAVVVYEADCDRRYDTPGVYSVLDDPDCAAGAHIADSTMATIVGVTGVLVPILFISTDGDDAEPPPPPISR